MLRETAGAKKTFTMVWPLSYEAVRAAYLCPHRLSYPIRRTTAPARLIRSMIDSRFYGQAMRHIKHVQARRNELINLGLFIHNVRASKSFLRFELPTVSVAASKIPIAPDLHVYYVGSVDPQKVCFSDDMELLELEQSRAAVVGGTVYDLVNNTIEPATTRHLYDQWEDAVLNYVPRARPSASLCEKCSARNAPCYFAAKLEYERLVSKTKESA